MICINIYESLETDAWTRLRVYMKRGTSDNEKIWFNGINNMKKYFLCHSGEGLFSQRPNMSVSVDEQACGRGLRINKSKFPGINIV